jgi:hypothetical protein
VQDNDVVRLLAEILNTQRQHLEEYRRVTQEQLGLQRKAVQRQEQISRLYQRVVAVGAVFAAAMVAVIVWLLSHLR